MSPNKDNNEINDRLGDPLFSSQQTESETKIFANKDLLRIGTIVESQRIVGREEEIQTVGNSVGPLVAGNIPSNLLIYGKTGTGKSLVSRHVAKRAQHEAERNNRSLGIAYVDCSQERTETRACQTLAREVNKPEITEETVPRTGVSPGYYYDQIWLSLDQIYDGCVIILDEVDRLKSDDILLQLSRAREAQKTKKHLSIIGISNKSQFGGNLSPRVESSLDADELVFSPYNATQLRSILENRRDAFRDGALSEGVIPRAAAESAQEHGDARKAVRLLRYAGEFAEEDSASEVTEDHLKKGKEKAELNRINEAIGSLPVHARYILTALANLQSRHQENWFKTTEVNDVYQSVVNEFDTDEVSIDQVRRLLKELSFLELIESKRVSGGRQGNYTEYRLLRDPDVVLQLV